MSKIERRIGRFINRKTGTLMLAGVLAAGCGPKPEQSATPQPTSTIYEGPITTIDGDKLMSDSRLNQLTVELQKSGSLFLEKIAGDVNTLHAAKNVPSELNNLVSNSSIPLVVVEDPISQYSVAWVNSQKSQNTFIETSNGEKSLWHLGYPVDIAIEIGSVQNMEKAPPIVEALFLAKESLSLMLSLRIGEEFGQTDTATLTDAKDNPITDPVFLKQAGLTIVVKEGNQDNQPGKNNSNFDRLIDVLPIMMIALEARDLVNKGVLVNPPGMGTLHDASDFLAAHPQTEQEVRDLMQAWASSSNVNGPEGFTKQIFARKDLLADIYNLNGILYTPTNK